MTLVNIVNARGGELYAGGTRALIPAPGHSPADRSVSLLIGRTGRVIVHSFGSATVAEITADLKDSGLLDTVGNFTKEPVKPSQTSPLLSGAERIRRATDLWTLAHSILGTPAAAYLRNERAIRRPIENIGALRYLPDCPLSVYNLTCQRRSRALLACIQTGNGDLSGIEITYLTPSGRRDLSIGTSRKIIGTVPAGASVRLDPPAREIVVGEGVMTVLSATEHLGLPGMALLSVNNLARFTPMPGVCKLVIAADRGKAGEAGALTLMNRLKRSVPEIEIVLPPEPYDDFNTWAQAQRKEKGRAGTNDV